MLSYVYSACQCIMYYVFGESTNELLCYRRINPFDQSATDVINTLDQAIDNAAFIESFLVRFLGSMEVKQDRGNIVNLSLDFCCTM